MRALFSILFFFFLIGLKADPVFIGLHYGSNYVRASVTVVSGGYRVKSGDQELFVLNKNQTADITASSGKVNIFYAGKNYADNQKISFEEIFPSEFQATPAGQKRSSRVYKQDLIALNTGEKLQLVNKIEIEEYVCGVIEAESGKGHEIEYYKVQAVISRTYALNNLTRHQAEGYQLCDATHCQVYHGKPKSEALATTAAKSTRDIIIVDPEIKLITAAFHSNCGGQTQNAEDVWSKPVTYLVGRCDTFCLNMPHSCWEKKIPTEKWNNYLESKRSEYDNSTFAGSLTTYQQQKLFFHADSALHIPLRSMREDLKLRSTTFEIHRHEGEIILRGQGFGHAVGLCQEGAMRMAQLGYCYEDIIHYYYKDVHLIPRYMMWFFSE